MASNTRRAGRNAPTVARKKIPKGVARLKSFALDRAASLPLGDTTDRLGIRAALEEGTLMEGLSLERSHMIETYGGGSLENVPGYDISRAITAGLATPGNVIWPQFQSKPPLEERSVGRDGLKPESVIGPIDTRRPVPNTTVIPWRCIALMRTEYADGFVGRGTGWFIAPRTLVTAAHNIHDQHHGRAKRIVVTPGFHQGAAPFGEALVSSVDFNPDWTQGFPRELDFALAFIENSPGVGFFGFAAASDQGLRSVLINITGYPVDRPETQWFDGGRITDVDENFIYHTIDTEGGQSGAPLFWSDRESRIGLAIHTYGASDVDRTNVARRITQKLFDLFQQRRR
jgi:glutamyl endopeptidase